MSMSAGGGAAVKAEPNVTPMIDVMLVLLIIFMVITPMLQRGTGHQRRFQRGSAGSTKREDASGRRN